MDVSEILRERMAAVSSQMTGRIAAIASPEKRFADILDARMGKDEEGVIYTKTTPDNWAPIAGTDSRLAAVSSSGTASLSSDTKQKKALYDPLVQQAAQKYGLSPDLIHAVILAESSYNPNAVSSVGAQGLMQLMPATARSLGVTNSFDAAKNIDGGANYLRQMLDRFGGDTRLALAAYNCGPNKVSSLGITSSADATAYTRLSDGVRSYVGRVLYYAGAA